MPDQNEVRELAKARGRIHAHVAACEICALARLERPGAHLCLDGKRLVDAAEALRERVEGGAQARPELSIGDGGIEDEA